MCMEKALYSGISVTFSRSQAAGFLDFFTMVILLFSLETMDWKMLCFLFYIAASLECTCVLDFSISEFMVLGGVGKGSDGGLEG